MNLPVIIKFVIDLLAVLLLALGIKGLSKVKSARDANRLAAFAMSLSVVGLLSYYLGTSGIAIQSWNWIIIGTIITLLAASKVNAHSSTLQEVIFVYSPEPEEAVLCADTDPPKRTETKDLFIPLHIT